jgi:putative transposase
VHTGRPAVLKTFDYLGPHRYFLTFCTFERRARFTTAASVRLVRTQILRACSDERMAVFADCYMPDHVHLLVQGQAEHSDCRRFISRAKQLSGFAYQQAYRQRLWQRYFHERVLRSDDDTLSVARYILENPVRAGLVQRAQDYPFSGSGVYSVRDILEAVALDGSKSG